MKNIQSHLLKLKNNDDTLLLRLKHLRGRHDQRDHAWNRGMGRGGTESSAASSHPKKAKVSAEQHRADIISLQKKVDAGEMTYHDMRNKLRDNRGYPPLPPRTRKQLVQDGKALAQAYSNVKPLSSIDIAQQAGISSLNNLNLEVQQEQARKSIEERIQLLETYGPIYRSLEPEILKLIDEQNDIFEQDISIAEAEVLVEALDARILELQRQKINGVSLTSTINSIIQTAISQLIDSSELPSVENPLETIKSTAKEARKLSLEYTRLLSALRKKRGDEQDVPNLVREFLEVHAQIDKYANQIASAIEQYRTEILDEKYGVKEVPQADRDLLEQLEKDYENVAEKSTNLWEKTEELEKLRYESLGFSRFQYLRDKDDVEEGIPGAKIIPYGNDEYSKQINNLKQEKQKLREEIGKAIDDRKKQSELVKKLKGESLSGIDKEKIIFLNIFESLAAENPVKAEFEDDGKIDLKSLEQEWFNLEERKKIISSVISMIPQEMFDNIRRNSNGQTKFGVTLAEYNSATERASAYADKNGNGRIRTGRKDTPQIMAHESLHLVQLWHGAMQEYLDIWAHHRVISSGESLTPLNDLLGTTVYDNDEISVKDSVDDPYTLKDYGKNLVTGISSYPEILTMAFNDLANPKFNAKDKELLRLAINAILRYLAPGTKTKSTLKERIKNLRGRHKQRKHNI